MDLFELDGVRPRAQREPRHRSLELNRPKVDRELVLRLAARLAERWIESRPQDLRIGQFDARLAEHVRSHGGWNEQAKVHWQRQGRKIGPAEKRLEKLQRHSYLTRQFAPTPKLAAALEQHQERLQARNIRRGMIVRQSRKERAIRAHASLSKAQKRVVGTLGAFRQMTSSQASRLGACRHELQQMHRAGLIERSSVLCNQQRLDLWTLTSGRGSKVSGRDIAKHSAGLAKPAAGVHRDQSKLLHDISVLDAVADAKQRFEARGFRHVATLSEHQLYQLKPDANSDLGSKYADAYLTFKSPGGDDTVVAVEFGNYRPSYMREKMAGVEADHALVYTHDSQRGQEYAAGFAEDGLDVAVHVIPSPLETER